MAELIHYVVTLCVDVHQSEIVGNFFLTDFFQKTLSYCF